ncbi:MAG: HAMP domain-containing protein [Acidobacteria bacterium]|nr:HAMP domain-containing protein [Acidobacteriota bacterium]MBV9438056.1 HAMP domain-containing protein [Acidobacteriota bacterium]
MRSLFFKIFAFFWLCTALIVGMFIATAQRPTEDQIRAAVHRGLTPAILSNAGILIRSYESGGCPALKENERSVEPGRMPLDLLRPDGQVLCDKRTMNFNPLPAPGTVDFRTIGKQRFGISGLLQGKSGNYFAVFELRRIEPPIVGGPILKRLLIAIIISGLICALLARYLTRPITRLRGAAQKIAAGDFKARAGNGSSQLDEVGQLVKDFDFMAGRLEILIGAQQRLISDVSHELRSPLTRLKLALDLARNDSPHGMSPALDRIEREAERLSALVGMLLTLSRLESGEALPETEMVHLPDLLAEIAADAEIEAQSRHCSVELARMPECWIEGNRELLRSAFENVVRNGIRYTEAGTSVRISAACNDHEVRVIVQDHGPGVPESELDKVFKPFYRVDTSRERRTGGVGLGLAIAERAIKLHNGKIAAGNLKEGGFQVEISLPMAMVAV